MSEIAKLTLQAYFDINPHGEPVEDVKRRIGRVIREAFRNGSITGDSESIVEDYGFVVEERTDYQWVSQIVASPELLSSLKELTKLASSMNAIQHAGLEVDPDLWSELNQATNKAKAIIAKAEGRYEIKSRKRMHVRKPIRPR